MEGEEIGRKKGRLRSEGDATWRWRSGMLGVYKRAAPLTKPNVERLKRSRVTQEVVRDMDE